MGSPQPNASYSPSMSPGGTSPMKTDVEGVGHLKVASLLGTLDQAMIWVGVAILYLIVTTLMSVSNSIGTGTTTTIPSWITPTTLYAAVGLLAAGLIIGVIGYVFFYLGFRQIKRGDAEFGAPTTLVMIGLIGFLMIALGIVVIVGTVLSAINSDTSSASSGASSLAIGSILGGFALIGLGGILGLVGVIGLVLGNWRAGSRYQNSLVKVGAIVSILPFASIIGYVLLLVGYVSVGSKLRSGWAPPPPAGWGQGPPGVAPYGYPPSMTAPGAAQPAQQMWGSPPPPPPPH
jgi:hypothetical protein